MTLKDFSIEAARSDPEVEFDKATYKRRSIVEQTIGWLKECRRIGTRFEKLGINFLAMVEVSMCQRGFRQGQFRGFARASLEHHGQHFFDTTPPSHKVKGICGEKML